MADLCISPLYSVQWCHLFIDTALYIAVWKSNAWRSILLSDDLTNQSSFIANPWIEHHRSANTITIIAIINWMQLFFSWNFWHSLTGMHYTIHLFPSPSMNSYSLANIAEYVEWKSESHCPAARGSFAWQCCRGQKQNHDFQETKDWANNGREWEWMMVLTWRREHVESRTEQKRKEWGTNAMKNTVPFIAQA